MAWINAQMAERAAKQLDPDIINAGKQTISELSKSQRRGFTLIEISLIFLIIGLMIGGIFVGKTLIEIAKTRATISDVQEFNTAVTLFVNKYEALPGDISDASSFGGTTRYPASAGQGDGDGKVEPFNFWEDDVSDALDDFNHARWQCGEILLFWADLKKTELIGGSVTGEAPNGAGWHGWDCVNLTASEPDVVTPQGTLNNYIPKAHFTAGVSWILARNEGLSKPRVHDYLLVQISELSYTGRITPTDSHPIPVSVAYNIDQKMDDANPKTGIVTTGNLAYSSPETAWQDNDTNCVDGVAPNRVYKISGGIGCSLQIRTDW